MKRNKRTKRPLLRRPNKYWTATLLGLGLTFVVGDNNIVNRISYDQQIRGLRSEIENYRRLRSESLLQLEELQSDEETLEALARENYGMVGPNEELFLLKD